MSKDLESDGVWGIPVLKLGMQDPLKFTSEIPCPDTTCGGTVVFVDKARFWRKPLPDVVDMGFETSALHCNTCDLYLLPAEIVKEIVSTSLVTASKK